MRFVVFALSLAGCVESATVTCGDRVCPAKTQCDDIHHECVTAEQLTLCNGQPDGSACTIDLPNDGVCDQQICIVGRCGDGYVLNGEACDGAAFAQVNNCKQLGYYDDKSLGCTAGCEIDRSVCTGYCGDGIVSPEHELCDVGHQPEQDCVDYGYGAGVLGCSENCGPGLSSCIPFGWTRVPMPWTTLDVHGTSASNIWVVGFAGGVQRFDGSKWSAVDVSACTTSDIQEVFVVSATDAFMRSGTNMIHVTAQGCTAATLSDNLSNGTGAQFVWAASSTEAYVGGGDGLWHYASGTWTSVSDFTGMEMTAVWGTAANNVYAATGGQLAHFDGSSWSTPADIGFSLIFGMWGTQASDVYVSGADASGNARVRHYNGSAWSDVLVDLPLLGSPSFGGGGALAGGHNYVTAYTSSLRPHLLASDGDAWMDTAMPLDINSGIPFVLADGSVYLAGAGNFIYLFQGSVVVHTAVSGFPANVLAARSEDEAYALYVAPTDEVRVWNGATWTTDLSAGNLNSLAVTSDAVLALTSGSLKMRTGPGAWTDVTTPHMLSDNSIVQQYVSGFTSLTAKAANDVWVAGRSGLTDSQILHVGTLNPEYITNMIVRDIWEASPTRLFAVGEEGKIAHYDGNSWQLVTSPTTGVLVHVWGLSATDVYATGVEGVFHYDGVQWTKLAAQPKLSDIRAFWGSSPTDLFAAGPEGLQRYDGQQWTKVQTGSFYGVNAFTGVGNALFVATTDEVNQIVRLRPW